jgi:ElaB/YqjD/DUF883 family membrane-anchored ribosome-binding protein
MQPRDRDDIVDNSPMGESYTGRSATREGDMGEQARERTQQVGEQARERAEQGRERAAGGMASAAEKLREQSEGQSGMRAEVGTKAADTMERGASYLREHDTQEIVDDVEKYVREHPMQALAGAVVGGFIIGRILR